MNNSRHIKLTFFVIFFAIALPVAYLLVRSYLHLQTGVQYAYQEHAYLVLQMLNQQIHNDLSVEEERSYSDYRFIRTVPVLGGEEITISPLAKMPVRSQYPGIIGYFQLFSDGSVQTPVLPDGLLEDIPMEDRPGREAVRKELKKILKKLNIQVNPVPEPQRAPDSTKSILDGIYAENLHFDSEERLKESRFEESSQKETFVFDVESSRIRRLTEVSPSGTQSVMVVKIEPFQAVFDRDHLVFFRNVTRGSERFVQGFAVQLQEYLTAVVGRSKIFEPQEQETMLEFSSGNHLLMALGFRQDHSTLIFNAPLQYPLDGMNLSVYLSQIKISPGEIMILLFGILLFIILGGGLLSLYRLMRGQIDLAVKRQDFTSAVSHELKTPLTAIRMYAEMLQNSWVSSEEKRRKYYNLIASEAERLSRLIQNVLNISKLDKNQWNIQIKNENPKNVLDAFVSSYGKNIENNGFDLTVTCDPCYQEIPMDRDAVMQVLVNLVDNSLKFAKNARYKMIELRLAVEDDVYFAVRDYGPGIPPSEMNKVFEQFYRVENEMTRRTNGTGIGLSMVKKLCSLTNMKIEMENANPGLRTKIHFSSAVH